MDIIFGNPDDLRTHTYWELYGPLHLIWLAGIAIVCILACLAFRKASPEKQQKVLKLFSVWILIQEMIKNFLYWRVDALTYDLLPLHICGISIIFCLWYAFKPGKLNGAYIYGVCLPGALSALIFSDWTDLPWYNFSALNSFTIHGELVIFAMLVLTAGLLKPDFNQIPKMAIVMYALAIPIYFLNKVWDTNFMFINYPSPGSPLVPLYDIFGNGYVIAAAVMLVVIWIILFLPWKLLSKKQEE